jgi:hypothetical protein
MLDGTKDPTDCEITSIEFPKAPVDLSHCSVESVMLIVTECLLQCFWSFCFLFSTTDHYFKRMLLITSATHSNFNDLMQTVV